MHLTPEQEAEIAKAIEAKANSILGHQSLIGDTNNPSKQKSEEENIQDLIGQLDKNINNRSLFRSYQ